MDGRTIGLLWNTAVLALGTVAISIPIGVFLAAAIVKTDLPGRRVAAVLIGAMLFVPLFAVAAGWEAGFGLSGWFTRLGFVSRAVGGGAAILDGWVAAIWIHAAAAAPWVALIVGVGLGGVEKELEEDALLDARPVHVFFCVTLRRAASSIAAAAAWIAVVVAGEMTVTDLFQIRTFAEEVYIQAATGDLIVTDNARLDASLSSQSAFWFGTALCGALFGAALFFFQRVVADAPKALAGRPLRFALGKWKWPFATCALMLIVLLIGVPIGNLIYKSGAVVVVNDGGRIQDWSIVKALRLFVLSPVEHQRELTASLAIAACASAAATGLAIGVVWWALEGWGRRAVLFVCAAMLLMLPAPIVGVLVTVLLNRPVDSPLSFLARLYDSNFAPLFVQTLRAFPFAILILWPSIASVPRASLDAARCDGAGWLRRLWSIVLPQRRAAVAIAWVVGFATAINELGATLLVAPPGVTPISVHIFNLLHYGVEDKLAALVLFLFFAALALSLATNVIWGRCLTSRISDRTRRATIE